MNMLKALSVPVLAVLLPMQLHAKDIILTVEQPTYIAIQAVEVSKDTSKKTEKTGAVKPKSGAVIYGQLRYDID